MGKWCHLIKKFGAFPVRDAVLFLEKFPPVNSLTLNRTIICRSYISYNSLTFQEAINSCDNIKISAVRLKV